LTYALSRSGNLNSSTAVQRNNSLQSELAGNESMIANNAEGAANELRGRVQDEKSQLSQQLNSSANPAAIASQANAATASIRAPSIIQPLGDLFADWSSKYLANQRPESDSGNIWQTLTNQGIGTVA
jgi:hypothetical protein